MPAASCTPSSDNSQRLICAAASVLMLTQRCCANMRTIVQVSGTGMVTGQTLPTTPAKATRLRAPSATPTPGPSRKRFSIGSVSRAASSPMGLGKLVTPALMKKKGQDKPIRPLTPSEMWRLRMKRPKRPLAPLLSVGQMSKKRRQTWPAGRKHETLHARVSRRVLTELPPPPPAPIGTLAPGLPYTRHALQLVQENSILAGHGWVTYQRAIHAQGSDLSHLLLPSLVSYPTRSGGTGHQPHSHALQAPTQTPLHARGEPGVHQRPAWSWRWPDDAQSMSLQELQLHAQALLRHVELCLLPACFVQGVQQGVPLLHPLLHPLAFTSAAGRATPACMPAKAPHALPPTFVAHQEGYVLLRLRPGRNEAVHRLVCWLMKGPPTAPHMHCAHLCGRPNCLNPDHLLWVWPITNSRMTRIHAELEQEGRTDLTVDMNRYNFPEQFNASFLGRVGMRKRGRPGKTIEGS
jgi:hypothetical protein